MSALAEYLISTRDALARIMPRLEDQDDRDALKDTRNTLAAAANAITERDARITALEGWWYAVPEEQRFTIMADAAWKRHEAAGPGR